MKNLMLALVIISLLSFGCATTENFDNFKCSDCYNQDSVQTAIIKFLNQKNCDQIKDNNYKIQMFSEDEGFWFLYCIPQNALVRGGGYWLKISKKQCKVVIVAIDA